MKLSNTFIGTLAVAGIMSVAATTSSNAGPSDGSTLGECYNNWISWCNEHTAGYPNSCYGESMDHCDGVHSASLAKIPGYQVKTMKTNSLRKAKRANAKLVTPTVTPVRRAN